MISSKLKKRFENSLFFFVKPLARLGFTPNMLTILGFLTSLCAAFLYLESDEMPNILIVAGLLVLLSGFIDALDGVLARVTDNVTEFGGFLDSVADRYSDAFVLTAITVSGLVQPVWGFTALIGSMMVSYSRSRAEVSGVDMKGVGLVERAERMFLIAFMTFATTLNPFIMNWGMTLLALLTHFTVIQRGYHFYKMSEKS